MASAATILDRPTSKTNEEAAHLGAPPAGAERVIADDEHLVAGVRAGSREAFAGLVRRYHASLTRVARGYVSTQQSAEEVAQEAWLGVLEGLERFAGRSSFKTWLFTILVNRAKTRGVREGRTVPFSSLAGGDDSPLDEPSVPGRRFDSAGRWSDPPRAWADETPEALLASAELRALLDRAVAGLPENYRLVITLRDIEELEADEVCRILEISEANQRVLLHRARARVRHALEEHLGR